jgi:GxxExxY protein
MEYRVLLHADITRDVIAAFYYVHNALRFGFLESVYCAGLERQLIKRGRRVSRQHAVQVMLDGEELAFQRLDMVVDDRVVVEVKATELLSPHAKRQLFNYLRATSLEVGILLHFGPEPRFYRVTVPNAG